MLMMKEALEFNGALVALCTVYAGNCSTKKTANKFIYEYRKLLKAYEERQSAIIKDIEANAAEST